MNAEKIESIIREYIPQTYRMDNLPLNSEERA
jgi:hypothetical protein